MRAENRVWLTSEAYQKLRAELATLTRHESQTDETVAAVDSDQDGVTHVRRRKTRIRQIRDLLNYAVVDEAPPDDGIAEPGMVLTVRFDADNDTETFLLGTREGSGVEGLPVYSPESPLGVAVSGARQGEQRSYVAPNGETIHVTLLSAVPFGRH